jgi:hypothetical protein
MNVKHNLYHPLSKDLLKIRVKKIIGECLKSLHYDIESHNEKLR